MTSAPRGIEVHAQTAARVQQMAQRLEALGHHVEQAHPAALDDPGVVNAYVSTISANVARALDAWGEKLGQTLGQDDVEPLTWQLATMGRALSAPDLLATLERVHAFGRDVAAWWQGGGYR